MKPNLLILFCWLACAYAYAQGPAQVKPDTALLACQFVAYA